MLTKRIIPCLDIRNNRTVKGVHFLNLRDAGDPAELAARYARQGADELVLLDITATIENRLALVGLVNRIARQISIPFTVGGGINTVDDVARLIEAGADKISINSAAVKNPALISRIAGLFGSQCVVVAIDTCPVNNQWQVFIHGGRTPVNLSAADWARQAEQLGAGEILLTSMENDGTKNGFALEITKHICHQVSIPVIASGGAGHPRHFRQVFMHTGATGALAAGILHYNETSIPRLKHYLRNHNIAVR